MVLRLHQHNIAYMTLLVGSSDP